MMDTQTIKHLENQYSSGVYVKRDLLLVRGSGACVYDADGNRYLDCVGGQGTANLGHAHPAVAAAIAEQAGLLISCPEMFYSEPRARLLHKLVEIAPEGIGSAFLCNSGTEAVEAAIKFARLASGKTEIIATMRSFHGRTLGALSATWNKKIREPFAPLVPGFSHVPYNRLDRLEAALSDETAAVILEVVQGEGGVHPGSSQYLSGAAQLCRERGILLIIDEVQTGFGRTGKMWAVEHVGLRPDLMAISKSMGGGMPIGAVLVAESIGKMAPGMHGSTFGGNPLACAAALAAIQALFDEGLPERAAESGAYLLEKLRALDSPLVREVRGVGLMVGIELKTKVALILQALMERRILALSAGLSVIRLLPPLVITREQIDTVVAKLEEVLREAS